MNPNVSPWHLLETRATASRLAVFVLGLWSLLFFVSRTLQADMKQLLGEQQFSVVTALAKQVNVNLNERLQSLEDIVKQTDTGLLGRLAALPSHGARPDAGLGGRLAA